MIKTDYNIKTKIDKLYDNAEFKSIDEAIKYMNDRVKSGCDPTCDSDITQAIGFLKDAEDMIEFKMSIEGNFWYKNRMNALEITRYIRQIRGWKYFLENGKDSEVWDKVLGIAPDWMWSLEGIREYEPFKSGNYTNQQIEGMSYFFGLMTPEEKRRFKKECEIDKYNSLSDTEKVLGCIGYFLLIIFVLFAFGFLGK